MLKFEVPSQELYLCACIFYSQKCVIRGQALGINKAPESKSKRQRHVPQWRPLCPKVSHAKSNMVRMDGGVPSKKGVEPRFLFKKKASFSWHSRIYFLIGPDEQEQKFLTAQGERPSLFWGAALRASCASTNGVTNLSTETADALSLWHK